MISCREEGILALIPVVEEAMVETPLALAVSLSLLRAVGFAVFDRPASLWVVDFDIDLSRGLEFALSAPEVEPRSEFEAFDDPEREQPARESVSFSIS